MNKVSLAERVVKKMYDNDPFSQWLGIEIVKVSPGYVKLRMQVRDEMNNGFDVTHGGITFSLADSALAFASNTHGKVSLALENNISFLKKVAKGDVLDAVTEEIHSGKRIGVYNILISKQDKTKVAAFRGTVFRTGEDHFPELSENKHD